MTYFLIDRELTKAAASFLHVLFPHLISSLSGKHTHFPVPHFCTEHAPFRTGAPQLLVSYLTTFLYHGSDPSSPLPPPMLVFLTSVVAVHFLPRPRNPFYSRGRLVLEIVALLPVPKLLPHFCEQVPTLYPTLALA